MTLKDTAKLWDNKKPEVDEGWALEQESPRQAQEESPLPQQAATVPCFWRGLNTPAPMSALAQGTQPEEEPEQEVPVFWRARAEHGDGEIPSQTSEPTDSHKLSLGEGQTDPAVQLAPESLADLISQGDAFDETESAFFAEGEELARQEQKMDDFLDLADRTLTFWQRLWRR